MNEEIIRELINLVKGVSPELWRIAVRQAYVNAIQSGFFFVALTAILLALGIQTRRSVAAHQEDKWGGHDTLAALCLAGIVITLLLWLFAGQALIGYALNPEYYAIKTLTGLVTGN